MHKTVYQHPAFAVSTLHFANTKNTLLIDFNYWSVSKTAETSASRPRPRPRPQVPRPRPRPQNFSLERLETKTAVSRTTKLRTPVKTV